MHEFLIRAAVGFGWIALWAITLRWFGLIIFRGAPEEHAARQERIRRLGKLRYCLIFGVLGAGFAMGLSSAVHTLIANEPGAWGKAAVDFVLYIAISGWMFGVQQWNQTYRGEVPFPPPFLSQK